MATSPPGCVTMDMVPSAKRPSLSWDQALFLLTLKPPPAILPASPVLPAVGTRGTPTSWHQKTFPTARILHLAPHVVLALCHPICCHPSCHPICPGPGLLCPHSPEAEDFLSHHAGEQKTIKTVITFQVMLNQVQGSHPLASFQAIPGRLSTHTKGLGSRLRSSKHWPAPYPRSRGMSGTWLARRVFRHLKNAVRRKAVFYRGRPKRHC